MIDLYPHNQQTYQNICEIWRNSNKAAAIQATGTGKSYLILQCLYDNEGSAAVVLAPSNYILDQLQSKSNGNLKNVQLLTYAKLSMMSLGEIAELKPSLIVLDEFHRCGAETWGKGVKTLLEAFPLSKILGTSATPVRHLDGERDMSDELFDGSVAVNLSLADAIVKGILPMPKYISALYTFDEEIQNLQTKIDKSGNDEESKTHLQKEVEKLKSRLNKSKGIPEILKKHAAHHGGKYIVFCKDKDHLEEMKSAVIDWFKRAKIGREIESYTVAHGYNGNSEELNSFRKNVNDSNVRLLFSIEMLNEGIHIDDVTGAILLRPTASPIIYYQQIGRALQAGNHNQPLIFDFVNNFNNVRTNTFIEDLKKSRVIEIERHAASGDKIVDIPDFTIFDETIDILYMFSSIENQLQSDWDRTFNELHEFIVEYGHYPKNDSRLGHWVSNQRTARNGSGWGLMDDYRVNKLNSIGFMWDFISEWWFVRFEELKKYLTEHDGEHPLDRTDLGRWVARQRKARKRGALLEYRKEKLDSIGFIWDSYSAIWDDTYQVLVAYRNESYHSSPPARLVYKDINIGQWVSDQRKYYKKGLLSQERIDNLNAIEFVWEAKKRSI